MREKDLSSRWNWPASSNRERKLGEYRERTGPSLQLRLRTSFVPKVERTSRRNYGQRNGTNCASDPPAIASARCSPESENPDSTRVAAVPYDDVTERDIQYGAQWPVCRSWCQCHPLSLELSRWGLAASIPACLENPPQYPPDAAPRVRLLRRYRSQFDRRVRADRRNLESANECGHARTSGSRNRGPEVSRSHLRRDLDPPTAAVTFFRAAAAENSVP